MPDLKGDLTKRDARRLLVLARLLRAHLGESEHVVIHEIPIGDKTPPEDHDTVVQMSLGDIADKVLREYEGHE